MIEIEAREEEGSYMHEEMRKWVRERKRYGQGNGQENGERYGHEKWVIGRERDMCQEKREIYDDNE